MIGKSCHPSIQTSLAGKRGITSEQTSNYLPDSQLHQKPKESKAAERPEQDEMGQCLHHLSLIVSSIPTSHQLDPNKPKRKGGGAAINALETDSGMENGRKSIHDMDLSKGKLTTTQHSTSLNKASITVAKTRT